MGERENVRARETRVSLSRAPVFFFVPTASKRLLRRLPLGLWCKLFWKELWTCNANKRLPIYPLSKFYTFQATTFFQSGVSKILSSSHLKLFQEHLTFLAVGSAFTHPFCCLSWRLPDDCLRAVPSRYPEQQDRLQMNLYDRHSCNNNSRNFELTEKNFRASTRFEHMASAFESCSALPTELWRPIHWQLDYQMLLSINLPDIYIKNMVAGQFVEFILTRVRNETYGMKMMWTGEIHMHLKIWSQWQFKQYCKFTRKKYWD